MIGLKKIRKKRNLNQQKVALDLNISREALSYYENGKREPSLALLVAMSKYYNVSINYLITGEEFQKVGVLHYPQLTTDNELRTNNNAT